MNTRNILNALGLVLLAFGCITLAPLVLAWQEGGILALLPYLTATALSCVCGLGCCRYGGYGHDFDRLSRREGLLIVVLSWVATAGVAAIPYLFYGLSPLDSYFEAVSGITTTGATILLDFSLYPRSFFFWRSLTQWLGGMGIIVLFVAILPQFAVAGRQIFFAEAPGPTEEKITPRIRHTAKALWLVYVLLTGLEVVLLWYNGMPLFDAVCNSLTTLAAGGFSPNPQSILGYQNPALTWIIILFMLLAGANFALQYRVLFQGRLMALFGSEEFRFYLLIIGVVSTGLAAILLVQQDWTLVDSVRDSLFQIVSILTTTGFASADFALWVVPAQVLIFSVMLVGGCAGSAGGGVKVVRILFGLKYLKRELVQIIHPNAVLVIKLDRTTVPHEVMRQILGFLLFYILLLLGSAMLVSVIESDVIIGLSGTAATIGNIGPGFTAIGPMASFGLLHPLTKLIFIVNMLIGRLELIPFLAMLHPDFWRLRR